jgi:ankyrin repeat protein
LIITPLTEPSGGCGIWYQRIEELPAEEPVESFWPMLPRGSILGNPLTTEHDNHPRLSTKRKFEQSYAEENISLFKRVRIINHGSNPAGNWEIFRNAIAAGEFNLQQHLQLIDLGVNINTSAEDTHSLMALHIAALVGHIGVAYRLIRNGVDVNAQESRFKRTALELAAEHGRLDIVQILILAGADQHLPRSQRYRNAARLANDNHYYAVANILELNFST